MCGAPIIMAGMKLLYTAFDAYPGHKGAQAHIRSNLFAAKENGYRATLLCLGTSGSFRDPESSAAVHACALNEENLLRRSEAFGRFVSNKADRMIDDPPDIIHFRDIWSGIPLLGHSISRKGRTVFEVNGLPSVELPARFPRLARNSSFIRRLRAMEDECLKLSDRVISISARTTRYLTERGCEPGKISFVPNSTAWTSIDGAPEIPQCIAASISGADKVILYTGTLAAWQGIPTLVNALAHLKHRQDFLLVVIASNRRNMSRLRRYIAARGLAQRTIIHDRLSHPAALSLYGQAYACVAPLARGPRNELQGCCPLKIIEAMASGTPVVASDLPVIREIIDDGVDGMLTVPDSPRSLAHALEALMDDRPMRTRLASAARDKARRVFTARLYSERLGTLYASLLGGNGNAVFDR